MTERPSAADRVSAGRLSQFKPKGSHEAEVARRRQALLSEQNEARSSRIADMRRIAAESLLATDVNDVECEVEIQDDEEDEDEDEGDAVEAGGDAMDTEVSAASRRSTRKKMLRMRKLHRTLFFARQLQVPDWMLDIPTDLQASWLMQVRPEGDRCLLLSEGGKVEVRRKNGYILERYTDSRLPKGLTVLEVICMEDDTADEVMADDCAATDVAAGDESSMAVEADVQVGTGRGYPSGRGGRGGAARGLGRGKGGKNGRRGRPRGARTYAVCDVLVWGDTELVNADAECRLYWLESRFSELAQTPPRRARPLKLISGTPTSLDAFSEAYHGDVGYMKDSFVFFHREGRYAMGESVTPLVLAWRDRKVSRYVVDTMDVNGEKLPEKQAVVLELRPGGRLRTADRAMVGCLTPEHLKELEKKSKVLVRCETDGMDLTTRQLTNIRPVAMCAARSRCWPDSFGRIVFQCLHRTEQTSLISFDAVMRVISGA
eukprot:gnl/TRDRNA2_/TRDRNA2_80124_c0_seq1.p1 gnl/TRDRNA2_/TRDRNA2_80124_c0~~gnl/TRDRNA2_/TRDRNA2_80124_c0_seq1.p1  ORF type:complete len:503 (-),score=98.85 gnl/TRDRNA2_/TRDRNA2_80124_c0_seq1:43-1506(-)